MPLTKALLNAGYETVDTMFTGNDEPSYSRFQKPDGLILVGYDHIHDRIVIRYHLDSDDNIGFLFNSRVMTDASLDIAKTMRTINSFETIAQTLKNTYDAEFHNK